MMRSLLFARLLLCPILLWPITALAQAGSAPLPASVAGKVERARVELERVGELDETAR